jgi:hypothetical protein
MKEFLGDCNQSVKSESQKKSPDMATAPTNVAVVERIHRMIYAC